MGTVHCGRTNAATGSASSAPIASVHTRCRVAAEARAAQAEIGNRGNRQQRGRANDDVEGERTHRVPPSRRRFSRALSRLYSSSEIGSASMPSSAAAADPGELSKNVRTSCFSAERLASSGVAAGK
jgi:hypothetical protein